MLRKWNYFFGYLVILFVGCILEADTKRSRNFTRPGKTTKPSKPSGESCYEPTEEKKLEPNYEEIYTTVGAKTFENDIIVPDGEDTLQAKNFIIDPYAHWPTRRIPYVIDPEAPYSRDQRALILEGLRQFHLYTCVRLVPRINEEDYVFITHDEGRGCSASVGRQGGRQVMYLRIPGCVKLIGTTIHEMLHNLGFFHEQSRYDRDQNVKIEWANIQPGFERNFESYSPQQISTLSEPYDVDSVLHYSSTAFSNGQGNTIVPFHADPSRLGQRRRISEIDVRKVNVAFQCSLVEVAAELSDDPVKKTSLGPAMLSGAPSICFRKDPLDAALFVEGNLYIFRKGLFWIFQPVSLFKFAAKNVRPLALRTNVNALLPREYDAIGYMSGRFYIFAKDKAYSVTSLNKLALMDIANATTFFKPVNFTVRGMFELENEEAFSDGTSLHFFSRSDGNKTRTARVTKGALPDRHDYLTYTPDGRLMVFRKNEVFVTAPKNLTVEAGFPRTFHSMFC